MNESAVPDLVDVAAVDACPLYTPGNIRLNERRVAAFCRLCDLDYLASLNSVVPITSPPLNHSLDCLTPHH